MSQHNMVDQIKKRLEKVEKTDDQRAKALREAEMLADRYSDIQPDTYSVPMEKFFGLPAFYK